MSLLTPVFDVMIVADNPHDVNKRVDILVRGKPLVDPCHISKMAFRDVMLTSVRIFLHLFIVKILS
jgi:hypothetical protein